MVVHALNSDIWDTKAGLPARDIQDLSEGMWEELNKVYAASFCVQILFLEKPIQGCWPDVSTESTA